jgi:L-ascorbate metabolism protein UlaG (beta-lactamase superfamily)
LEDLNVSHLSTASTRPVFLKPEVKFEPLVCRWYAWSYLIAPAQLALHIADRILPLMRSFASNPSVHVSANSDPDMYGGPFVSLGEADVARVEALIAATELQCADLIRLAEDLHKLDAQLQDKATGFTLNEFYAQLPPALQGLVELVYDLHHRPSVRLFESMLYEERLADGTQEVMLQAVGETGRHFFMSTPRLDTPDSLSFKMKFSDRRLDALASMRSKAASFDHIAELLEVDEQDLPLFRSFFTERAPGSKGPQSYDGEGVRMRYFGHACVLFQTAEVSILFDPFVSIEDQDDHRLTMNDLPDVIDYVVISHSHQDHFSPEMLIQLRHRIKRVIVPANNSGNLSDPSMKLVLRELGFEHVDVVDSLDRIEVPGGHVLSLPFTGEHADLSIYSKHAIALELGGRKFMFLVDSDGRDPVLYEKIMRQVGPVDALFIGMECHGAPLNWLYEPLLGKQITRRNNESRRLSGADCERAMKVLAQINPPRVFVYAMGQEPWMQYIMGLQYKPDSVQLTESNQFIAQCGDRRIVAERLFGSRELVF